MKKFNPEYHLEFWCNDCDAKVVVSDMPETGDFFIQYGHTKRGEGEYIEAVFSLCHTCQSKARGQQ